MKIWIIMRICRKRERGVLAIWWKNFFESEWKTGLVLIVMTCLTILLRHSKWHFLLDKVDGLSVGGVTMDFVVNEGLMTGFFFLMGLELKKEFMGGEFRDVGHAAFPFWGAMGGMVVPLLIYLGFNINGVFEKGWGIPMATDIAFAVCILSFLGRRVPRNLKMFLMALAIVDDLGAILVIAIFYNGLFNLLYLGLLVGVVVLLFVFKKVLYRYSFLYFGVGVGVWLLCYLSGVHPTISGVVLGFLVYYEKGGVFFEKILGVMGVVNTFFILPLFAFFNGDVLIGHDVFGGTFFWGIFLGLFFGKPVGIFTFCYLGVLLGWAKKPVGATWLPIFAISIFGGIGFTMSIFMCVLSFLDERVVNDGKVVILFSCVCSIVLGLVVSRFVFKKKRVE